MCIFKLEVSKRLLCEARAMLQNHSSKKIARSAIDSYATIMREITWDIKIKMLIN